MRVAGIDPGKQGAVAIPRVILSTVIFPTQTLGGKRPEYDIPAMVKVLVDYEPSLVVIEQQQAMPKQGVSSSYAIGYGFGLWRGIAAALGLRVLIVRPNAWKKVMLAGIARGEKKAMSIIAAQRLFPGVDLKRTPRCKGPDHNIAEALLLAEYGRRIEHNG